MVDGQHKLSRRALLGAVCASPLVSRHSGLDPESTFPSPAPTGRRWIPDQVRDDGVAAWDETLARFNQAQAVLDSAKSEPNEDAYDRLLDSHSEALTAKPCPERSRRIEIIVPNQAWELTGSEDCLEILRRDARRLAATAA